MYVIMYVYDRAVALSGIARWGVRYTQPRGGYRAAWVGG